MSSDAEQSVFATAFAAEAFYTRDVIPQSNRRIHRQFHRTDQDRLNHEAGLRLEGQRSERARIARELHDTMLQGILGASLLLDEAVDQMPADSAEKHSLGRIRGIIRRVLDEGRVLLRGLRSTEFASASIEEALSAFLKDFSPNGARCEISVVGREMALKPEIQEQIYLIGREALINALLHSKATTIEVEVEYSRRWMRVIVRDNGRGIDPRVVSSEPDSHWGLLGMHERAQSIGAELKISSRPGAGTEVEIFVPSQVLATACA
jgi:signal transduction histidine kinase